jgi:serine/threonine-protein kinase PRP4
MTPAIVQEPSPAAATQNDATEAAQKAVRTAAAAAIPDMFDLDAPGADGGAAGGVLASGGGVDGMSGAVAGSAGAHLAAADRVGGGELAGDRVDAEGYYKARMGELLGDRYRVSGYSNRGVFSCVLNAKDERTGEQVAVKVIRANEVMLKAGNKEESILSLLMKNDPDGRHHCVRFYDRFVHHDHLCLVFEQLSMNLREVLKKYGSDVGLNLRAVQIYAKQLFMALRLIRKVHLIHGDIKPDNILVDARRTTLKLADFGSAMFMDEVEVTPYLVTRFYRAPEIMLGLRYDTAIDMWSVGCTLYEIYTGKILFPGHSNNDMLRLIQEVKGRVPKRLLGTAAFRAQHFDDDGNFLFVFVDRVTDNRSVRTVQFTNPTRDLLAMLVGEQTIDESERRALLQLRDLLEKCLMIDPSKRITVVDALAHPFLSAPLS